MTQNYFLFVQWLRRDLAGRYRGAWLGSSWPVLQPLLQIAVFTLVFYEFMRLRWPSVIPDQPASDSAWIYAVNVLAGLCVFNFFSEVIGRSPTSILAQPNLVTKVRFPLSVLPMVTTASATVHLLAGGLALWLAGAWSNGLTTSFWLVPLWFALWLVPVVIYGMGVALLLSGLGVFVRDIQQIVPAALSLLMFLTPIFYPLSAIPQNLQTLFSLNPIAWAAESLRAVSLGQAGLDLTDWVVQSAAAGALFTAGWLSFQRLRRGFSDVL